MTRATTSKLRILFRGWILQHSYAMVFTNQLITFVKKYKDQTIVYLEEREYFNPKWNSTKKFVFSKESKEIIDSIYKYNGEDVDIIYNVTFPYDITPVQRQDKTYIPKLVFYTSEFATLDSSYFSLDYPSRAMQIPDIENVIGRVLSIPNLNIYMTCPSKWSAMGLQKYTTDTNKNVIISHGVSDDFYKHSTDKTRKAMRKFYNFSDSDIVLLVVGSMTQNKGIIELLSALFVLTHTRKMTHFKLLLKGSDSLYDSRKFIQNYIRVIIDNNKCNEHFEELFKDMCSRIVYIDDTLSNKRMNDLFNACDIYVSGYLAEGFNLVPLEALASGMSLVISRTGSTSDYINTILSEVPDSKNSIHLLNTSVIKTNNGFQNTYTIDDFVSSIISASLIKPSETTISNIREIIYKHYSWDVICDQLFELMNNIVSIS